MGEKADVTKRLNAFFQSAVEIPRMRIGRKQEVETLIREEAWLFAKYLRKERKEWNSRLPTMRG